VFFNCRKPILLLNLLVKMYVLIFFLRKRDLEIEERLWSFNTFHQSEVHYRLKVEDETNTLGPKKALLHQDFGSTRKKRTHRFMGLKENRNMPSYSTELHQLYKHTDESTPDEPKLRCTRHYFLADDTTQDPTQAVYNKKVVLKIVKTEDEDVDGAIFLSDGGGQYQCFHDQILMNYL